MYRIKMFVKDYLNCCVKLNFDKNFKIGIFIMWFYMIYNVYVLLLCIV